MGVDTFPLRRIDHVRFFVGNARQSAYFYRNAFGFEVVAYEGLETGVKHEAGYVLAERNPDYVVLGETRSYSFERITRGIRLIADGARFIAANPDVADKIRGGKVAAAGALVGAVMKATRGQADASRVRELILDRLS